MGGVAGVGRSSVRTPGWAWVLECKWEGDAEVLWQGFSGNGETPWRSTLCTGRNESWRMWGSKAMRVGSGDWDHLRDWRGRCPRKEGVGRVVPEEKRGSYPGGHEKGAKGEVGEGPRGRR